MAEEVFIDVPEAGRRVLGVGKARSYELVNRGVIPVIRIGRRYLVPVAALNKLTAEMAASATETASVNRRRISMDGETEG